MCSIIGVLTGHSVLWPTHEYGPLTTAIHPYIPCPELLQCALTSVRQLLLKCRLFLVRLLLFLLRWFICIINNSINSWGFLCYRRDNEEADMTEYLETWRRALENRGMRVSRPTVDGYMHSFNWCKSIVNLHRQTGYGFIMRREDGYVGRVMAMKCRGERPLNI